MQIVCICNSVYAKYAIPYSPFIGFECSQSRSLHHGDCSEQHPSSQREFRDCLRQLLVITPVLRLLSHFMICCSETRHSGYFTIRFIIGSQIPKLRKHFDVSSFYFSHAITEVIVKIDDCHLWFQYFRK